MSFRGRLTLFFLLIVVLPMIAVAVLVTQVAMESRNGKADARLAAGLDSALAVYRDDAAAAGARRTGSQRARGVSTALRRRRGPGGVDRAHGLPAVQHGIQALVLRGIERQAGRERRQRVAVAPYQLNLNGPGGRQIGSLTVSTTTPLGLPRRTCAT